MKTKNNKKSSVAKKVALIGAGIAVAAVATYFLSSKKNQKAVKSWVVKMKGEVVKKLENLFKETFNATMFNWSCLMNDAFKDSSPKPQVHWHFRPRYENPVEIGGHVFKDSNFGHHYLRGADEKIVSKEILKAINDKLQENLIILR